jgi:phosphoserine phosphatase RsbU/P
VNGHSVSIEVVLEPAREVGGDLVDHFQIGEDLLVLALGDVSDKGAGAAMMMARTHALLRGLAARPDAETLFRNPAQALDLLNATLSVGNSSGMFVTFLLASVDLANGGVAYVRAGHVPPFLSRAGGSVERLNALGGLPLGMPEQAAYRSSTAVMAPGDRILVVTDGYTEAEDPAGALFGAAPIEAFMAALAADAAAPLRTLTERVHSFESGRPPSDDMAAILLSLGAGAGK